jgi:hypothetical protein
MRHEASNEQTGFKAQPIDHRETGICLLRAKVEKGSAVCLIALAILEQPGERCPGQYVTLLRHFPQAQSL